MRTAVAVTFLLATVLPCAAAAQAPVTITGRVTSEAGAPAPDVSVFLEGMAIGTTSRVDGRYTVTVPGPRAHGQAATLSVRLIGYRSASLPVTLTPGATLTRDFTLQAAPLRLDEVVVTGAGTTQKREALGNVVTSVAPEEIRKSAESNIVNALAAKAPNIEVTSQAGDPGAGSGIIIRGLKTIEGNGQPLFVVDGQPIDNSVNVTDASDVGVAYTNRASDINPNDIESVEVLAGAAASSIYGLRAANGVILITTKSGRSGATRYTLNSMTSFDDVNRDIPLQTRFDRGVHGVTATCHADASCQRRSWGAPIPAGTQLFDHFHELFRTGTTFDNSLQVSGGDDRRTFFASGGSTDQKGVLKGPNSFYDRQTARAKATQMLGSSFKVGANAAYSYVDASFIQKGNNLNGVLLGALRQPADFNAFPYYQVDPSGSIYQRAWTRPIQTHAPRSGDDAVAFDNPFWVLNEPRNTSRVGRTIGNIQLNWFPREWLTVDYTLGGDYGNENRLEALPPTSSGDAFTGQLWQGTYTNFIVDHNLLATMRHSFGSAYGATLSLGQNLNSTRFDEEQVKGTGYISPDINNLNNLVQLTPQDQRSVVNLAGYFASLENTFGDQLYLTLGIRRDQSSALGPSHRVGYFPKASLAWNVTNALGNKEQRGWLSYLKARTAVGEVGRAPFPYEILTTYGAGPQALAYGTGATATTQDGQGGLRTNVTRGDLNLHFERTRETEAGFDFGLLDQRVDGSATYYSANTRDVIFQLPVAGSTGYQLAVTNGARVTNKGIEVQLNTRIIDLPSTKFSLGLNWARNRNKLVQLNGATYLFANGGFGVSAVVKGQPLGAFYGTDFVRCRYDVPDAQNVQATSLGDQTDVNAYCRAHGAKNHALFLDADGFPLADQSNYVIGNPNPNWLGSVRPALTILRRVQLTALVDIKNGGDVWNGTRGALQSYGTSGFTADRGATKTFGIDFMPGPTAGPGAGKPVQVGENWYRSGLGNNFNGPTAQFVENGGYSRLREVSVAYSADQRWVRDLLGMSSVDLRVAGRNLLLHTKYTGIDPETNLTGPIGVGRGQDYFNSPQTRSWLVNVTLNR